MKLSELTYNELLTLATKIHASPQGQHEMVLRAVQNQIADRYLETIELDKSGLPNYNHTATSLTDKLITVDVKQLDQWLQSFLELNIQVPQELYQVLDFKKQKQSRAYMNELLKGK
jgi:hypothetical protein